MGLPWELTRLVGDRIVLDPLRATDADDLYAMQSDPAVCRYLLYEPRSRTKVDEVLARDSAATRLAEPGDYIQPALRRQDGAFLGTMYLELKSADDRTAEIGWILRVEHQGRAVGPGRAAGVDSRAGRAGPG